ncbi:FxsA family protein [Oricola sp.]|uniref:FxsA family protein n=1 Tax=Oricola sp. TaxID=1979950 RepID=UPI003BAC5C2C
MPFSLIPFLLLAIPLAEIGVFIAVGSQIGVFATLGMVVLTAVIGSVLLRVQGFGLLTRMRAELDGGNIPGRDLVHGVMILMAGVLLLTPGFVTDTLGFLLFVPVFRDGVWRFARDRIRIVPAGMHRQERHPGAQRAQTIDLSDDEYTGGKNPESPWSEGN